MTPAHSASSTSTPAQPVAPAVRPMPPRRALFVSLLVAWGIWIVALLFMYFTTVYSSSTTN